MWPSVLVLQFGVFVIRYDNPIPSINLFTENFIDTTTGKTKLLIYNRIHGAQAQALFFTIRTTIQSLLTLQFSTRLTKLSD